MTIRYFGGAIAITLLLAGAGCSSPSTTNPSPIPQPGVPPTSTACTEEAKLCSDGSYVGRIAPSCEFAPCPRIPPEPQPGQTGRACSGPNDTSCGIGFQCIEKCGPPLMRDPDPDPGYECVSDETAKRPRVCPICLAANTLISTPQGALSVQDITVGTKVWSLNSKGEKIMSTVIKVLRTPVPATHRVVHLRLVDGRELFISPQHPTIDGGTVGALRPGDSYDGSRVVSATLLPYQGRFTYDLLPDSATGAYVADDIWMGSTLR